MKLHHKIANWLEKRWVGPAYGGGLLTMLSIFFFGAATNTMAGWLYVISGISFALLAIAAILPQRSLVPLKVHRSAIDPVSVGEQLTIELAIENPSRQAKSLLEVYDLLPSALGEAKTVIENLPTQDVYKWVYYLPTHQRGVYHWSGVRLRTATPLGLFWCSRQREAKATAIVYPTVLPLVQCPLIDELGLDISSLLTERGQLHSATEGITRTLRPYRYGDPTRLIHWRSSARYGQLRVRELEVTTGGQDVVICLDSAMIWEADDFEQAVIAAASLYFYACRRLLNAQLWTAKTGLVNGNRTVLHALAAVQRGEEAVTTDLPRLPIILLTQNPQRLNELRPGSRWLLWPSPIHRPSVEKTQNPGFLIRRDQPLQFQLQASLR